MHVTRLRWRRVHLPCLDRHDREMTHLRAKLSAYHVFMAILAKSQCQCGWITNNLLVMEDFSRSDSDSRHVVTRLSCKLEFKKPKLAMNKITMSPASMCVREWNMGAILESGAVDMVNRWEGDIKQPLSHKLRQTEWRARNQSHQGHPQ